MISDILTLQEDRIKDLKRQIEDLEGQTKGRNEQLKVKNAQIEKLNENIHELTETMRTQLIQIQTLLSQYKQIPEYAEKKTMLAILVTPATIIANNKINGKAYSIKNRYC